jgi:hypothetical protein
MGTAASYVVGVALLLGALLVIAGLMKLARPRAFEHAVHRLLPGRHAWETTIAKLAPAGVGATELLLGAGLLGIVAWPAPLRDAVLVASSALYLAFSGVVVIAIRKGRACGCYSSFSDGPAGGVELGRSLALALAAVSTTSLYLTRTPALRVDLAAAGWVAASAAVTAVVAAVTAGIASPLTGGRSARSVRADRDNLAGRQLRTLRGRLGFLLGRVTSSKSDLSLPRVVRLGDEDRDLLVEQVRATRTGQALDEWLVAHGLDIDWTSFAATRTSMRTEKGLARHALLTLPEGAGLELAIAVPLRDNGTAEPIVAGRVDGRRLVAIGGTILLKDAKGPPGAPAAQPGGPATTTG